jgi:hypothetical protein
VRRFVVCLFILFFVFGCVDRLFYDVATPGGFGMSISGHITDNGGPHRVNVFRNFDIESRDSLKTGVSARSVVISDGDGNSAELSQVMSGVYETKVNDITGRAGGIYKIKVELEDGRVYESVPDTLPIGGVIDTTWYKFVGRATPDNYIYEYEIYANSTSTADPSKTFFAWSNKMTYKATTKPEAELNPPCYPREDKPTICNFIAPCSGIKNVGNNASPVWNRVGPCTCCTCWYEQYSPYILLSDNYPSVNGRYKDVLVDRVRQSGWNMMYKMRIEVSMQSMSLQAYRFWKAVRDQRSATTNIFQPITGKIPGNIIQTKGADVPSEGVFYATSSNQKVFYISRGDTPISYIPKTDYKGAGWYPCQRLAPNYKTTMPSYWID